MTASGIELRTTTKRRATDDDEDGFLELPGLGLASTLVSAVGTRRTPEQVDSDDLVLNVTVAGRRIGSICGERVARCTPPRVTPARPAESAWR